MRWLLIFLLLLSSLAIATSNLQVAYLSNQVRVVLSKTPCESRGFRAAAQNIDSSYLKGCWTITKENMIKIRWQDGDFTELSPDMFNEVGPKRFSYKYK